MASLGKIVLKLIRGRQQYEPDWKLMIAVGAILLFGLMMLASATSAFAYLRYGDSYYFFKHQIFGLVIGLVVFLFFANIDYRFWKKYAFFLLLASIALLALVFIPSLSADYGKARSWINVFGFSLQPSEIVKLCFLIYLAAWLENREKKLHDVYQSTIPFLISLGIISLLIIMQPDLGTLMIIAVTSIIVYFVGGGSFKHIIVLFLLGSLAVALLVQFKPYQLNRFKCLVDPSFSSQDVCYQVNQSLIAVGSGGLWGRGLGQSRQKLMYLPEVSGDSIFAVISEEVGFVFSIALIIAFLYFFYRGILIAKQAPDRFGRILAVGIASWIAIQAIINIGGMVNIMPMTGITLPFISYGGSSLLATLAAVGILVNISKHVIKDD